MRPGGGTHESSVPNGNLRAPARDREVEHSTSRWCIVAGDVAYRGPGGAGGKLNIYLQALVLVVAERFGYEDGVEGRGEREGQQERVFPQIVVNGTAARSCFGSTLVVDAARSYPHMPSDDAQIAVRVSARSSAS